MVIDSVRKTGVVFRHIQAKSGKSKNPLIRYWPKIKRNKLIQKTGSIAFLWREALTHGTPCLFHVSDKR